MPCATLARTLDAWQIAKVETLTGTTTPGQSGPGSNVNEKVPHSLQSSRTRASSSDAI